MFKRISQLLAEWRSGKQPKPQTYDLTDADLVALRRLQSYEEWDTLIRLIDNIVANRADSLLYINNNAQLHFLRGQLAAMRELPLVIHRMAQERDNAARSTAGSRNPQRRTAALYGTPSWSARD